jgi:glycosyltransferase involved in cell wall biosynthesis
LLADVQALLAGQPNLRDRVTLLGARPHGQLEDLYNSADYFVLGSHSESGGYALLEALACGVIPVVTDIPSFRRLTDDGRVGALWRTGDADAFAEAFTRVVRGPVCTPEQVAASFEQRLSYAAVAGQAIAAYRDAAMRRTR